MDTKKLYNIAIAFVICPMIVQSLRCYQCVATKSTFCEPTKNTIVQCPLHMQFCAVTSLATDDMQLATRACTNETNGVGVACSTNKAFNIVGTQCYCTEDLCNSSDVKQIKILSTIFFSLLVIFCMKFAG